MGKYSSSSSRRPLPPKQDNVHPAVRGIGCVSLFLIPIIGYGLATLVVPLMMQRGLPLPADWFGRVNMANPMAGIPLLGEFMDLVLSQDNLIVNLVFTAILSVLLFGVLSIVYGYMYNLARPSRYGPMDVPPPNVKTKKYRR